MPRLLYSIYLIDAILQSLNKKRSEIRKPGSSNFEDLKNYEDFDFKTLELEEKILLGIEALSKTKKRIKSITDIKSIPVILPSSIMLTRSINSHLFEIFPEFSQSFCELSTFLASIVMDSATITQAKFDFKKLNLESNLLFDEAKLIVDSKINKLCPNLHTNVAQNA